MRKATRRQPHTSSTTLPIPLKPTGAMTRAVLSTAKLRDGKHFVRVLVFVLESGSNRMELFVVQKPCHAQS